MKTPTLIMLALLLLPMPQTGSAMQNRDASPLPFNVGEVLSFRATSSRFGSIGTATMRVEEAEDAGATAVMLLAFDFTGRVGPFRIRDRTRSWVQKEPLRSVRFDRSERSPLRSKNDNIVIFPDERRWESGTGARGSSPTNDPLDELSFLYFLRTLPLRSGDVYEIPRHFDARRKPVAVRVMSRQRTEVPAGSFATVLVEMQVNGDGMLTGGLRLYLTDDAARIPVQIESSAPWVGRTSLRLQSLSTATR
jgi:hypothetical protein